MTFDRRTVVAGLGAALPVALTSSCARAEETGWPGPETPAGQLPKLPIGMNLAGIADYEPGFPFRNLMWGARAWLTCNAFGKGPWNTGQAPFFEYDEDGYPLEVPIKTPGSNGIPQQVFTLLPNVRTPGVYVLLYDGDGAFDAVLGTKIISASPGRVLLKMTHSPSKVEVIVIRTSKRGNHIRNIRVVALADEKINLQEQPFLPEMLAFASPFKALRMMDWGSTNNSLEQEWATRRRSSYYTMAGVSGDPDSTTGPEGAYQHMLGGSVAHEIIIQAANTLMIDPWICIPHRASDDYIRQCAALYRDRLDPRLKIYVEYSNELWNWGFRQAQWMLRSELAGAELERKGVAAWKVSDGKREGMSHPERIGALFSQAYRLWTAEWPGPLRKRVTTVCAVQSAWADASIRTIDWCHRDGTIDAVSPAAYFGPDAEAYRRWNERGADLTAEEVLADMWRVLGNERQKGSPYAIATRAAQYGLRLVNYEGGQHIQPERQQKLPYMPALAAAQSHPEMYKLYIENLRINRRLGSSLFCAFNSVGRQGTQWGSWGVKARYSDPNSENPKIRALLDCNA